MLININNNLANKTLIEKRKNSSNNKNVQTLQKSSTTYSSSSGRIINNTIKNNTKNNSTKTLLFTGFFITAISALFLNIHYNKNILQLLNQNLAKDKKLLNENLTRLRSEIQNTTHSIVDKIINEATNKDYATDKINTAKKTINKTLKLYGITLNNSNNSHDAVSIKRFFTKKINQQLDNLPLVDFSCKEKSLSKLKSTFTTENIKKMVETEIDFKINYIRQNLNHTNIDEFSFNHKKLNRKLENARKKALNDLETINKSAIESFEKLKKDELLKVDIIVPKEQERFNKAIENAPKVIDMQKLEYQNDIALFKNIIKDKMKFVFDNNTKKLPNLSDIHPHSLTNKSIDQKILELEQLQRLEDDTFDDLLLLDNLEHHHNQNNNYDDLLSLGHHDHDDNYFHSIDDYFDDDYFDDIS